MWSNVFVFWLNVYCGPKQKIISCYIASIVFIRNKCFFFVLFLWFLSNVKECSRQSWEPYWRHRRESRRPVGSKSSSLQLSDLKIFFGFILIFVSSATIRASCKRVPPLGHLGHLKKGGTWLNIVIFRNVLLKKGGVLYVKSCLWVFIGINRL